MQCQSYFPVCHSHYDLNGDANGGARPIYNGHGPIQNRHCSNYVSSSPVPQVPLAFGKEFLRQTMLVQEVTFQDQVQELHRLYARQKELMTEIRNKELCMNQLRLEAQSSNSFSTIFSSKHGQNNLPLVNSHCYPSTAGTGNIQFNFFQEHKSANATPSKCVSHLNNLHFLEQKGKKVGGKLLDLELPAEVYIDTEDRESLEDPQFFEEPTSASSSNKLAKFVVENNNNLADLNEPSTTSYLEKSDKIGENAGMSYVLDILGKSPQMISDLASDSLEFNTPQKAKHVSVGSCQGTPFSNLDKNPFVVQALPSLTNQLLNKGAKKSGIKRFVEDRVDASSRSLKIIACKSKLKESMNSKSSVNSDCLKQVNGLNCFDLNSAVSNSEFTPFSDCSSRKPGKSVMFSETRLSQISVLDQDNNSVDGETTRKMKKCRLIDINLPCDPNAEDEPLFEDDQYQNDDSLSLKSSTSVRKSLEIDLEAPASPEVEEGSPPRGHSERNRPKVILQVPFQENVVDSLVELEKAAADVIVSMSSSKSQLFSDIQELSDISNLEWFADFIQSMSIDLKTDLETLTHDPTCGADDFETMTLKLTEMKWEEHLSENNVAVDKTGSISQHSQMKKGRTRRSKRKDFQREVLPSLASLSRYEVTEDIQMMEGLMEAAGTPWQLNRTKRACRMGRKSRTTEQLTHTFDVLDLKNGGFFISWGKVPRRTRGHRSHSSPSKWVELLI